MFRAKRIKPKAKVRSKTEYAMKTLKGKIELDTINITASIKGIKMNVLSCGFLLLLSLCICSQNKSFGQTDLEKAAKIVKKSEKGWQTKGDYEVTFSGPEFTIRKYKGEKKQVIIPSLIENCKAVCIAEYAFRNNQDIESVVIPEGVKVIDLGAFANCASLVDVQLPSSLTTLEDGVFMRCENLESLRIPSGVSHLHGGTFAGCSRLKHIDVDSSNPFFESEDGILYSKDKTELRKYPPAQKNSTFSIPPGVVKIGSFAFMGATNMIHVDIPNSVKYIEAGAFSWSGLQSIKIPGTVRTIDTGSFSACASLTNVIFLTCEKLQEVTLPATVAYVHPDAFINCPRLSGESLKAIERVQAKP